MSFARRFTEIREFVREVWSYGLGKAGLVLFFALIAISIAAAVTIPPGFESIWYNLAYWADYPKLAPPAWVTLFGVPRAHHQVTFVPGTNYTIVTTPQLRKIGYEYMVYSVTYTLREKDFPQGIMIEFIKPPTNLVYYSKTPLMFVVNVTRPDGYTITVFKGSIAVSQLNTTSIQLSSVALNGIAMLAQKYCHISPAVFQAKYASNIQESGLYNEFVFGIPVLKHGVLTAKPLTGTYRITMYIAIPNPVVLQGMLKQPGLSPAAKKIAKEMLHDVNILTSYGISKKVKFVVIGDCYGLLGTDMWGRDLAMAIFYGFPIAILVGFFAAVLSVFIGGIVGVISGYYGGAVDEAIQRIIDIVVNIPLLPLLVIVGMIVQTMVSSPWERIFIVIGFLIAFSWGYPGLMVRSMALSIKAEPYIEAARAAGASNFRIIFRHIFPQVMPYLFANLVFSVPAAVLTIAGLNVLGFRFGLVSWGAILSDVRSQMPVSLLAWWWVFPPGLCLALLSFTFVALGIAMETVVDPRLRGR